MRATALSRFSNFLTGLQSVNGATPAKLPQLYQAASRPARGLLGQFLLTADHDGAGGGFRGFPGLRFGFVYSDVVICIDREKHLFNSFW
jgi:hypothetical protein